MLNSLEKPLRSDRIREYDFSSEVDEESSDTLETLRNKCALHYESAFNPVEDYAEETWLWKELPGSHIFENSLVTVAVKYQGNAGAFTRISKYSDLYGLELDEFEVVYRESAPERISKMSGIRKSLQDVWISESPRVPSLFNFSEEAIEKERREFFGKQKSIQERARSLVHGLSTANIETSEWLSYLEISFYLREAHDELAQFGHSCQVGKWNISILESTEAGKDRSVGVEHPKGRIVIKESKVTGRSDDSSPLGYPARKLSLEVNGGGVLEVLYHEKMYGVDYVNKGKILTHSSLMWLGEFLGPMLEMKLSEEYFEARVNRVREEKANWDHKVGKLTKQEEAASKPGDSEPLRP